MHPYRSMSHPKSYIYYMNYCQKKQHPPYHLSHLMQKKHLQPRQRCSAFMAVDVTLLFTAFTADVIAVTELASLIISKIE